MIWKLDLMTSECLASCDLCCHPCVLCPRHNTVLSNTERSSGPKIFIIYSKFSVYRMKQPLRILKHAMIIYSTSICWKPTKCRVQVGCCGYSKNK